MFLGEGDPDFIEWAIDAMLCWKQAKRIDNLIQIHGDKDKIFPVKRNKASHIIKNGTHLMVFNRADEVSGIINQHLAKHS